MAGYNGWSMSNNAVAAYEDGEKPLSKWTKADIFDTIKDTGIELKCSIEKLRKLPVKVLKEVCLKYSSWHHTSNHYNRTEFYSLDINRIENLTDEKIDRLLTDYKEEKKMEEKPSEEKWRCSFLEWSGTRKHPVAKEMIEEGIVKGNWFYRKDGSKKKTTANGIDHQILYRKKDGTIKHYASVPKNKKTRHIPMQKDIEKLLQKYKNETYFISVSSNINIDGYTNFVFLNREEGLFTPNTLTRTCHLLRESCNKEEIEVAQWEEREPVLIPDFTFHVLRHTFCTRMAEDGMDVKVLQEIMGHSNIAVTMQVYNHVSDDRAINEMNKIQNVIGL